MSKNELLTAVDSLNAGLCVVYPTSTLPGLGCKPTNQGLDRLYSLKNRNENMPVSLGVFDMKQVEDLVYFNQEVIDLLNNFPKGSITLILPAKKLLMLDWGEIILQSEFSVIQRHQNSQDLLDQ